MSVLVLMLVLAGGAGVAALMIVLVRAWRRSVAEGIRQPNNDAPAVIWDLAGRNSQKQDGAMAGMGRRRFLGSLGVGALVMMVTQLDARGISSKRLRDLLRNENSPGQKTSAQMDEALVADYSDTSKHTNTPHNNFPHSDHPAHHIDVPSEVGHANTNVEHGDTPHTDISHGDS
jgi:hypothetical protein